MAAPDATDGGHVTHARLPLPHDAASRNFRAVAGSAGLPVEDAEGQLTIRARLGGIVLRPDGDGTRITLHSDSAADLQELRDTISARLSAQGLSPSWTGTAAARPANLTLARVVTVQRLSPSYRRVTVEGAGLARMGGARMHFRLLLGPRGDWPRLAPDGTTDWPGGIGAWHRPVYTTRQLDTPQAGPGRLVFDVFLHDGGRVTDWSARLRPGDEIALQGPNGREPPPHRAWMGFVADETALPFVARCLAQLPATTKGTALLCVPCAEDIQPLSHPEGVTLRWLLRSEGHTPLTHLPQLKIPDDNAYLLFAGERAEAEHARQHLAARGLPDDAYRAASYWTRETTQTV